MSVVTEHEAPALFSEEAMIVPFFLIRTPQLFDGKAPVSIEADRIHEAIANAAV
jgi:hypothetical protein